FTRTGGCLMAAKKSPATRLEAAHSSLRDIDRKLAQVDAAKVSALLADDDEAAAGLEAKAEELRRLQTVGREKIRLLEGERDRAENERREKEKETKVARLEATLAGRDAAGAELQTKIREAEKLFRQIISLSEKVAIAWPWGTADFGAALLTAPSIASVVQ